MRPPTTAVLEMQNLRKGSMQFGVQLFRLPFRHIVYVSPADRGREYRLCLPSMFAAMRQSFHSALCCHSSVWDYQNAPHVRPHRYGTNRGSPQSFMTRGNETCPHARRIRKSTIWNNYFFGRSDISKANKFPGFVIFGRRRGAGFLWVRCKGCERWKVRSATVRCQPAHVDDTVAFAVLARTEC